MVAEVKTKHKGIWYLPGDEIPEDVKEEVPEEHEYTKTYINRMPVEELKKLAEEKGIEDAENATGAQLKEALIALMGL